MRGRTRPPRAGRSRLGGLPGPKAYFAAAGALAPSSSSGFGALAVTGGTDGADARGAALPPMGTAAETGLSPTSYSSSPSSDAYAGIKTRKADAEPLTIEEAFPKDARTLPVPESEIELELAAEKLDGDCAAAVWGASVAADLAAGCGQAVRGLYADADGGYGLAVAVFNLASAADGDRFVATLGDVRGGGFVRPLPAEGRSRSSAPDSAWRGASRRGTSRSCRGRRVWTARATRRTRRCCRC
ncbi:hypothetical protein BJF79_44465 [Actinomadura sp. CNU-125]|nr:hypothetical protein BJF79_44465 [Actinomadura sp. CNU-125]